MGSWLRRSYEDKNVIPYDDFQPRIFRVDGADGRLDGDAVNVLEISASREGCNPNQPSLTRLKDHPRGLNQQPKLFRVGISALGLRRQRWIDDFARLNRDEAALGRIVPDLDVITHRFARLKLNNQLAQHEVGMRWRSQHRRGQRSQASDPCRTEHAHWQITFPIEEKS